MSVLKVLTIVLKLAPTLQAILLALVCLDSLSMQMDSPATV